MMRVAVALSLLAAAGCARTTTPAGMPAVSPAAAPTAPAVAAAVGPTVLLVRHAEKAADSPTDPTLTEAGRARAEALARALAGAGVTHVITTELQRTRLTADPLVRQLGLAPEVVTTQDGATHVARVLAAIRRVPPGGVVLVVGHSNTVPMIVGALGAGVVGPICDARYDDLFVVTPTSAGARLVQARYGAPSPSC